MVGFGSQKHVRKCQQVSQLSESVTNVRDIDGPNLGLGPGNIGLDAQKFCYNPLQPKEAQRGFHNETLHSFVIKFLTNFFNPLLPQPEIGVYSFKFKCIAPELERSGCLQCQSPGTEKVLMW